MMNPDEIKKGSLYVIDTKLWAGDHMWCRLSQEDDNCDNCDSPSIQGAFGLREHPGIFAEVGKPFLCVGDKSFYMGGVLYREFLYGEQLVYLVWKVMQALTELDVSNASAGPHSNTSRSMHVKVNR